MAVENLTIRIHGCDGSLWPVYGQNQGAQGVIMAKDQVEGLFAAPVRTSWKAGNRQRGGSMKGRWFDWRDLKLGFHIVAARVPGASQEDIMSRFVQAFSFEEDEWDHDATLAKIEVTTNRSTRFLDVQMHDETPFNPGIDPLRRSYANMEFPLRAGQPLYYEDPDVVTIFSTSSTSATGTIRVSNPTDTLLYQQFIGTRGQWTLPDVSWAGKKYHRVPGVSKLTGYDHSSRSILMPVIGTIQGGFVVDLDPQQIMVRDAHDTNLLGQMPVPGMYFMYPIPPWTPETDLPVSVTGAPAGGAMLQCIQKRRWQWPIGGQ